MTGLEGRSVGFRPYISGSATGAVIKREEVDEDGEGCERSFCRGWFPQFNAVFFKYRNRSLDTEHFHFMNSKVVLLLGQLAGTAP